MFSFQLLYMYTVMKSLIFFSGNIFIPKKMASIATHYMSKNAWFFGRKCPLANLIKSGSGFYSEWSDLFVSDPVFIQIDPTFLLVTRLLLRVTQPFFVCAWETISARINLTRFFSSSKWPDFFNCAFLFHLHRMNKIASYLFNTFYEAFWFAHMFRLVNAISSKRNFNIKHKGPWHHSKWRHSLTSLCM